jgi:16S rRNA (guanine527-N7)-methyltransferase
LPENYDDIVRSEIRAAGLNISADVQQKLGQYCSELRRWNARINLTALKGTSLVKRLIVEPVWIAEKLQMTGVLLDIGSGSGSPAIPICITRPIKLAHLVEARTRKAAFLRHVASTLQLSNVEVHRARFEHIVVVEALDWITLQAVSPSRALLESAKRISKPETRLVWITSKDRPALPECGVLRVPSSTTEIRILTWSFSPLDPS